MAFGRLERPKGNQPMSEINMTPLIDVMLVLLVIFMLTAPLMSASLKLNLPRTEGARTQPADPKALRLDLLASGDLQIDGALVSLDAFRQRLAPLNGSDTEVHLRADQAVPYGRVAEVLGLLQQAGLHRIAFMAQRGATGAAPSAAPPAVP
ncbi:MAG: biopolymer transporter ExbD [Rubrivivax sp.]|nr:MAG: biopolymer transporter ExbD [Rubrivivax sp.]